MSRQRRWTVIVCSSASVTGRGGYAGSENERVPADGRFAPSPTGPLHLGSLRTALVAWLFARSQGARFLLRVEDLDPQRSRPEFERSQIEDLRALGLDWDGPVLRQSARGALYEEALRALDAADRLYPCFCSRAEIREAASAPHNGLPDGAYPGTCRALSVSERRRRVDAGEPFALRVRADAERIEFEDRLMGARSGVVDDFVVRRRDGVVAYQLAVVVDDADQGIGEVVRGADLLDSTPRQLWLAARLDLSAPSFTHVPLVLGGDGARLAKRHGAVTLADRGEQGESADTVRAHLAASLGLAEPGEQPSSAELVSRFDPDRFAPPPSGPLPGL
jgi:glutamyl-tRNA synthetase